MGGFASSRVLEVHGERMLKRTFDPGFRIRLHQKDLNLALSAARELGVALPNTAIAQQMFASCAAHGGAELDHSALVQAIEGLAGCTEIREEGEVRAPTPSRVAGITISVAGFRNCAAMTAMS